MVAKSLFILACVLLFATHGTSFPLSTSGQWIIDSASGNRVKLHCVNWASHMETMLAEGLDKRPIEDIVSRIVSFGFNCVRLTWSTYMFTRQDPGDLPVSTSFEKFGPLLDPAKAGILANNPTIWNLSLVAAFDHVLGELGAKGVMVILDNHVSKPQWCCSDDDGNGFFGDTYFDPEEWKQGLQIVAGFSKGKQQVVGISMRNELRGKRQNVDDWYRYMQEGAQTIHDENPDLLIFFSGLNYDTDLGFLKDQPLPLTFNYKLVYEAHWYSWSEPLKGHWTVLAARAFAEAMEWFDKRAGFVVQGQNPVPLFLSEFGGDLSGGNVADNRFLTFFFALMSMRDWDWNMWALQGSYYIRDGVAGHDESFGILDSNWDKPRNLNFLQRLHLIQQITQGPGTKAFPDRLLLHPLTGGCVEFGNNSNIELGDCGGANLWSYAGAEYDLQPIYVSGTSSCLQAVGHNLPVIISTDCTSNRSKWRIDPISKVQISVIDDDGRNFCLHFDPASPSPILSVMCLCLNQELECLKDPQPQWFNFVQLNVAY